MDPGNDAVCVACQEQIRFAARSHQRQVIVNVYEDGVWKRVDHYHEDCYRNMGEPFGPPSEPISRAERAAERARAAERRSGAP